MKKIISLFLTVAMLLSFSIIANAETQTEELGYGYIPYEREKADFSLYEGISLLSSEESEALPEKYDSRDYGYVSPVKNQGTDGACWAFAANGAVESYCLKFFGEKDENGIVKNTNEFDFSENHIRYMMSGSFNNPLGYNVGINSGGNTLMSSSYFLGGYGPVLEKDDPYSTKDIAHHRDYSATKDIPKSEYRVDSVAFVPQYKAIGIDDTKAALINQTKRLVKEYGSAVCAVLYATDNINEFYNSETSALYCCSKTYKTYNAKKELVEIESNINHQVLIVGWDDTYSKDNFKTAPDTDGAFIIKNSHGENSNNKGYFYLSYCDYNLFSDVMAITSVTKRADNEIIYNLDPFGMTGAKYFDASANPVSYGNAFQKKTENEKLSGVSFYAFSGVIYNIYLLNDSPQACEIGDEYIELPNYLDKRILLKENFCVSDEGYYTLRLENKRPISSDKFSIIIEADSTDVVYMPAENNTSLSNGNSLVNKVTAEEKESFYIHNNWYENVFKEQQGQNFCIKAITETSDSYAEFELANFTDENGKEKTSVSEGDTVYVVPAVDYANLSDKQIICVGYNDNQMKFFDCKNASGQNRFKFENVSADFGDCEFYMFVWGLYGLEPIGKGIKVN